MKLIECYDIGGTNLRGAIFDSETDKILVEKIVETKRNKEEFLKQLKEVSEFLRSNVDKEVAIVSLGVPGPVENNILLESPPMQLKEKIDFPNELGFVEEVCVLNDMGTAVLAENYFGEGKNLKSICLVTISTGIGVGTIIDGKIIPGGEYGHDILERDGPECSCGKKGCWVSLCSGYGIEKKTGMKPKDFFGINDEDSIKKLRDYNAHGFGNIINAVCVDKIVVMGAIGLEQFDKIIPSKEEIKRYTINKIPDIVPTKLGKDIGLLGAYVFGKNKLR